MSIESGRRGGGSKKTARSELRELRLWNVSTWEGPQAEFVALFFLSLSCNGCFASCRPHHAPLPSPESPTDNQASTDYSSFLTCSESVPSTVAARVVPLISPFFPHFPLRPCPTSQRLFRPTSTRGIFPRRPLAPRSRL